MAFREICGERILVDYAGRPAPKSMPDGYTCVLIDEEWVVKKVSGYEAHIASLVSMKDITTMISQMATLYPTKLGYMTANQIHQTAKAWYEKLKDYDVDTVKKAFKHCTDVMSQPPVPADIIKAIKQIKAGVL